MVKIKKAIIPVGGLGTRFLPATKTVPKEMLPIVDKPVVQYIVQEALEAGIEQFIFVTGRNKNVIEDYFDDQAELYSTLEFRNKFEQLQILKSLQPSPGKMFFTRQQNPLGLGHAILCARDFIIDEPFAVLLPDMVMLGELGCLSSLIELYNKSAEEVNVLGLHRCLPQQVSQYGIVSLGAEYHDGFVINDMVEKPALGTAPSNLYINGRYILQPQIFTHLEQQFLEKSNKKLPGELDLTDAMRALMREQNFYGYEFMGKVFDCGSKIGFLSANLNFALKHDELKQETRRILLEIANDK